VSDGLWLCEHAAYGPAQFYKGALEEARRLLAQSGGYQATLERTKARRKAARKAWKG